MLQMNVEKGGETTTENNTAKGKNQRFVTHGQIPDRWSRVGYMQKWEERFYVEQMNHIVVTSQKEVSQHVNEFVKTRVVSRREDLWKSRGEGAIEHSRPICGLRITSVPERGGGFVKWRCEGRGYRKGLRTEASARTKVVGLWGRSERTHDSRRVRLSGGTACPISVRSRHIQRSGV